MAAEMSYKVSKSSLGVAAGFELQFFFFLSYD
jgi:hypothetical protein